MNSGYKSGVSPGGVAWLFAITSAWVAFALLTTLLMYIDHYRQFQDREQILSDVLGSYAQDAKQGVDEFFTHRFALVLLDYLSINQTENSEKKKQIALLLINIIQAIQVNQLQEAEDLLHTVLPKLRFSQSFEEGASGSKPRFEELFTLFASSHLNYQEALDTEYKLQRDLQRLAVQFNLLAEDLGDLFGLQIESVHSADFNQLYYYRNGALSNLPELPSIPNNILDFAELAAHIDRAGGKVKESAARSYNDFNRQLIALQSSAATIITEHTTVSERLVKIAPNKVALKNAADGTKRALLTALSEILRGQLSPSPTPHSILGEIFSRIASTA